MRAWNGGGGGQGMRIAKRLGKTVGRTLGMKTSWV